MNSNEIDNRDSHFVIDETGGEGINVRESVSIPSFYQSLVNEYQRDQEY